MGNLFSTNNFYPTQFKGEETDPMVLKNLPYGGKFAYPNFDFNEYFDETGNEYVVNEEATLVDNTPKEYHSLEINYGDPRFSEGSKVYQTLSNLGDFNYKVQIFSDKVVIKGFFNPQFIQVGGVPIVSEKMTKKDIQNFETEYIITEFEKVFVAKNNLYLLPDERPPEFIFNNGGLSEEEWEELSERKRRKIFHQEYSKYKKEHKTLIEKEIIALDNSEYIQYEREGHAILICLNGNKYLEIHDGIGVYEFPEKIQQYYTALANNSVVDAVRVSKNYITPKVSDPTRFKSYQGQPPVGMPLIKRKYFLFVDEWFNMYKNRIDEERKRTKMFNKTIPHSLNIPKHRKIIQGKYYKNPEDIEL